MKRYITFSGEIYSRYGGAYDIIGQSDNLEEAKTLSCADWTNIYDTIKCEIVLWKENGVWMNLHEFEES